MLSARHTLNIAPLKPLIHNHYYSYVKFFFSKEVFSGYSIWKVVDVSALPECLTKPLGGDNKMTDHIGYNNLKDQNAISTSFGPFRLRFCFPFFQNFPTIILPLIPYHLLRSNDKVFGTCVPYIFSRHKTSLP